MRHKVLLLLSVGLLALVLPLTASSSYSPRPLNAVASWLAMRSVTVQCLTESESAEDIVVSIFGASAYVKGWNDRHGNWHPFSTATFAYGHCELLLDFLAGDLSEWTVDEFAWAILVITHESGHLRGHRWSADEAKTQCWAMQHFRHVARRLGVTDEAALSVLVDSARRSHARMPSVYHTVPCELPTP